MTAKCKALAAGEKQVPRTCPVCQLGPCKYYPSSDMPNYDPNKPGAVHPLKDGGRPQLPEHVQRVVQEHADLKAKLEKLTKFMQGQVFFELDTVDKAMLIAQQWHMTNYLGVLTELVERHFETQEKDIAK